MKRTTINLPDELWKAAKHQALDLGKDFQELVADGLRRTLDAEQMKKAISKMVGPAQPESVKATLQQAKEITNSMEKALRPYIKEREQLMEAARAASETFTKDFVEKLRRETEAVLKIQAVHDKRKGGRDAR